MTVERHGVKARGLLAAVVVGVLLFGCSPNEQQSTDAKASRRSPRPERVALAVSGDEYEHSGNLTPLAGTLGTECPPTHGMASVPVKCWTWRAKGLGGGTYLQVFQVFTFANIAFTFTLTHSSGDAVSGVGAGHLESEDPTGPQAVGHVRKLPHTMTLTGGTGRFAGVHGELTGEFTSTVVGVDVTTGVVHKKIVGKFVGDLRSSPE